MKTLKIHKYNIWQLQGVQELTYKFLFYSRDLSINIIIHHEKYQIVGRLVRT